MKLFKVTNIADTKRGFEAEGKMNVLLPNESMLMRKPPKAKDGVFTVEEVDEKVSKKFEEKKIEKDKKIKTKTTNKEEDKQ